MTMATTVAERAAGLSRRYIVLLAVPVAAGFLPFLLSRELTQAIPAAAFVVFYGLLAVAAGASGIAWILHAARLALHTRPNSVPFMLGGGSLFAILVGLVSNFLSRH